MRDGEIGEGRGADDAEFAADLRRRAAGRGGSRPDPDGDRQAQAEPMFSPKAVIIGIVAALVVALMAMLTVRAACVGINPIGWAVTWSFLLIAATAASWYFSRPGEEDCLLRKLCVSYRWGITSALVGVVAYVVIGKVAQSALLTSEPLTRVHDWSWRLTQLVAGIAAGLVGSGLLSAIYPNPECHLDEKREQRNVGIGVLVIGVLLGVGLCCLMPVAYRWHLWIQDLEEAPVVAPAPTATSGTTAGGNSAVENPDKAPKVGTPAGGVAAGNTVNPGGTGAGPGQKMSRTLKPEPPKKGWSRKTWAMVLVGLLACAFPAFMVLRATSYRPDLVGMARIMPVVMAAMPLPGIAPFIGARATDAGARPVLVSLAGWVIVGLIWCFTR